MGTCMPMMYIVHVSSLLSNYGRVNVVTGDGGMILLHVFVPQLGVCPNFKDFRLWNPVLHEQYFGQYRDSVNVKTGDGGITSWPYFV